MHQGWHSPFKETVSHYCACTKLLFLDRMLRNQKMRGEYKENLEKSICIALGQVQYYTKTSQDYRSMIYCSCWVLIWEKIWIFWHYFYGRWLEVQKMGSTLMPIEGLFLLLASIQAQIIVKGICRNETATIKTVRKKPLRHWCDWGDLVEGSFVKQIVLQWRVSKLLNEPPYGWQNQTNRDYVFRKTSAMKS